MVHSRPRIRFTYQDYKNTPEDKNYELFDGDLVVVPSPKYFHQRISIKLSSRLENFVEDSDIGVVITAPFDVVLTDVDVVQPDIMFISTDRANMITEDNLQGAPDLVIEILSPSTAERDRTFKRSLYALHEVREYWIVDPDAKTVEVLRLGNEGFEPVATYNQNEILTTSMFEGLELNLSEVF